MGLIETYERKFRAWIGRHFILLVGSILGGCLVYFQLLSGNLLNNLDGIWHTSNFVAGNWEISLGRGLLRYLDKVRFGVVSVPFNSILAICIIAVGIALMLDLLQIKNEYFGVLISGAAMVSPTVCCTLTYSYHAVNYAMAFFFAVVTACSVNYIGSKNMLRGILCGSSALAITMAIYQPYMGVACILLLMLLIQMLVEGSGSKPMIRHVTISLCIIPLGGFFYWLFTQFMLHRAGMELAGYGGAGSVSIGKIITSLPVSFVNCYKLYYDFFITYQMNLPLSLIKLLLWTIGLLVGICVIYQAIRLMKQHVGYGILFIVAILLIPVACNFVTLVAVGSQLSQLMTMAIVLSVALICVLLPKEKQMGFFMKRAYCVALVLLLWFSVITVTNDQLALEEGKTATISLTENILHTLTMEGYLEEGNVIALVGRPAENGLFAQSVAFDSANSYAQFGRWSIAPGNHTRTWAGVIYDYCGSSLNICDEYQYDTIRQREEVKKMPEFPKEGSIQEVDGVIVVKVSEVY